MQQLHTKGRRKTKDWKFNWNQSAYSHVWSSTQTHTHTHPHHVLYFTCLNTPLFPPTCEMARADFDPLLRNSTFLCFACEGEHHHSTLFFSWYTHTKNYSLLHIWALNLTRNKYSMSGPKAQSQVLVNLRASACGTGPSRLTQHLVVGLSEPTPVDFWVYTHKTMSNNRHMQINLSITMQICILK